MGCWANVLVFILSFDFGERLDLLPTSPTSISTWSFHFTEGRKEGRKEARRGIGK
jgi:hypothetical protein